MHWNTNVIIITINVKLRLRQRKQPALSHYGFFRYYTHASSESLPSFLRTLKSSDATEQTSELALFLIEVYNGTKFCCLVLEIADIRVPAMNIRIFSLFRNSSSCLPARAYVRVGEPS